MHLVAMIPAQLAPVYDREATGENANLGSIPLIALGRAPQAMGKHPCIFTGGTVANAGPYFGTVNHTGLDQAVRSSACTART